MKISFLLLLGCALASAELVVMSAVKGVEARSVTLEGDLRWREGDGFHEENDVVNFAPNLGEGLYKTRYSREAGGEDVWVYGLATPGLEGKFEPPLAEIVQALGGSFDVGGLGLELDGEKVELGDAFRNPVFSLIGEEAVMTPVARYSPKGEVPFGVIVGEEMRELGKLTQERGDSHQCLLPPPVEGVKISGLEGEFGIFLKGPHFTSFTEPGRAGEGNVTYSARVYAVTELLGRELEDAVLVCFEEAKNADYQDAVFLLEGVRVTERE